MSCYTCTSDESEKEEAFRTLLHDVYQRLDKSCLESVKYQCRDYIGRGKLEKISNFLDLFTVLEERDIVSSDNVEFLISCLNCIPRKDLLKLVRQYISDWLNVENNPNSNTNYVHGGCNDLKYSKINEEVLHKQIYMSNLVNEPSDKSNKAVPFNDGFLHQNNNQHIPAQFNNNAQQTLINFMASSLTLNWQATVRFLGVPDDIIQASQYNWPNDLKHQIYEALIQYTRIGGYLTRENVIEALRLSGRMDMVEELMALPL